MLGVLVFDFTILAMTNILDALRWLVALVQCKGVAEVVGRTRAQVEPMRHALRLRK
jgi:hypothetical protein